MNGFTKEAWEAANQKTKDELLYGAFLYLAGRLESIPDVCNNQKKSCETKFKKMSKALIVLGVVLLFFIVVSMDVTEWKYVAPIIKLFL